MDIELIFLAISAVFNVLLGTIIVVHGPKDRLNVTYAFLVAILVLWIASISILRITSNYTIAFLSLASAYVFGVVIAATFWHFVMFFTKRSIRWLHSGAIIVGGLFVGLSAFFAPGFIEGISSLTLRTKELHLGLWHLLFVAYFIAVMADAFIVLYREYRKRVHTPERGRLASVFLGTFITTIIGSAFNILFVEFGISDYISWGPVATVIMVAFITYAIMRHNFLNVKVIGAEFFTILLILLLVIQLVLSEDQDEFIINAVSLALATGFGIFLIRSVLQEVRNKEQIAKLARELEENNLELKKLNEAKSEFISITSHQLRTPLSAMKGYLSMALEGSFGKLSLGLQEKLSRVYKTNERLIRTVNDLLDVSKIEQGKMEYRFAEVDLKKLLQRIIDDFEGVAMEHNLKLKQEISEDLPNIYGDEDKLFHVLANLMDNAIHYTPSGSISLRAFRDSRAGKVIVAVKDTGIGLEPEDMDRLYTKFARGHMGTRAYTEGAGLGLFVAKSIVEAHQGRIWAESEGRGKGSTFFVELPVQQK